MKKKINFILLSALFLTTLSSPVYAQKYDTLLQSKSNEIQIIDDLIQDEKFLGDFKKNMIDQYGKDYEVKLERNELAAKNANIIESKFPKNKIGESIYPNYIGGLYIDNDNNLVIQLVEQNIPESQDKLYKSIIGVDPTAKIEYVNYSYEELNEVYNDISDNFLGKTDNLIGVYIDVISNKVAVELKELTNEKITEFKKNILDSSMISFNKATIYRMIATVNPGGAFVSSMNRGCSYGYRAKMSSGGMDIQGVVTAGHCFDGLGNFISEVGTVIKYQNSGPLDAAFVANSNGATLTNTISTTGYNAVLNTTVNSSPVVGQNISKLGKTTGLTSGVINSINYSYADSTFVTHNNLIKTTMNANNGDSGGIAFQPSVSGVAANATVGIMHAVNSNHTESLVVKASLINSNFGLSRY